MRRPLVALLCLVLFQIPLCSASERESVRNGDIEMHCVAVPSMTLTPEAAQDFNIERAPERGLLTITVIRHMPNGEALTQPAQVFAGAISLRNSLSSIPVREVRRGNAVFYLGEFRVNNPDTLRFLVNGSAAGKPLNANFSRNFVTP